jgi:hypothetical protein
MRVNRKRGRRACVAQLLLSNPDWHAHLKRGATVPFGLPVQKQLNVERPNVGQAFRAELWNQVHRCLLVVQPAGGRLEQWQRRTLPFVEEAVE